MKRIIRNLLSLLILFTSLAMTGCSEEDDILIPEPSGSLAVQDQPIQDSLLTVTDVIMNQPGWMVIRNSDATIVGGPQFVSQGIHEDIEVLLKMDEIQVGETLDIYLHTDDGVIGQFEYDGSSGVDETLKIGNGEAVEASFKVLEPNEAEGEED